MKTQHFFIIAIFFLLAFASCSKTQDPTPNNNDNSSGSGNTNSGNTNGGNSNGSGSTDGNTNGGNTNGGSSNGSSGNGSGSGNTNTTITYVNASFTPIVITVNNQTQTIAPGGNYKFTGTAGTVLTGTATTSGHTAQGTVIGNVISWPINNGFPASGNLTNTLNVGPDFFYLRIKNTSSIAVIKLYVNYQLVNQTVDNITINNDGLVYGTGYYKAFSNSNVRAENGNFYWYWASIPLPFTQNQAITLAAN